MKNDIEQLTFVAKMWVVFRGMRIFFSWLIPIVFFTCAFLYATGKQFHICYLNNFTPKGSTIDRSWADGGAGSRDGLDIGSTLDEVSKYANQHGWLMVRFPAGDATPFVAYVVEDRSIARGDFLQFVDDPRFGSNKRLWRIQKAIFDGSRFEVPMGLSDVTLHPKYLEYRHFLSAEPKEAWRIESSDVSLLDLAYPDHKSFNVIPINYPKAERVILSNCHNPPDGHD